MYSVQVVSLGNQFQILIMKVFKHNTIKTKTDLADAKSGEFGRRGYGLCGVVAGEHGLKVEEENNG